MRNRIIAALFISLLKPVIAIADDPAVFDYSIAVNIEENELDGLTLGDDPDAVKLTENTHEIEFELNYQYNNKLTLFFGGNLFDEVEKITPANQRASASGFERGEMGLSLQLDENIDAEISIGRLEFLNDSETWILWDEDLDAIRFNAFYNGLEAMVGFAREQARVSTDLDFIDPEEAGIERLILSLDWFIESNQRLGFYYLDHNDQSSRYLIDQSVRFTRADEEDANLSWKGIRYLGEFESAQIGELELELNYVRLSGDATLYVISDPENGNSTIDEIAKNSISANASGISLGWTPANYDFVSILLGQARGSGDRNNDDNRIKSYRQTGIQGDSDLYGKLYQPELSNLQVDSIGIEIEIYHGIQLSLIKYSYRQDQLAQELRNVSIDLDSNGISRDLGNELDLIISIEANNDVVIEIITAEFDPGHAYGSNRGDKSRYWSFELGYLF